MLNSQVNFKLVSQDIQSEFAELAAKKYVSI